MIPGDKAATNAFFFHFWEGAQSGAKTGSVSPREENPCDGLPGDALGFKIRHQLATKAKVVGHPIPRVEENPLCLSLEVQNVVA